MTPQARNRFSFVVMMILVFMGANLLLVGEISTGPHRYISFGITGWFRLHRYGETWLPQGLRWSIESVSIVGFWLEVAVACLLTGFLSLILKSVRARLRNGHALLATAAALGSFTFSFSHIAVVAGTSASPAAVVELVGAK